MRIRFSVRDLLWLTLVAAMAIGWWLDRGRIVSQRDNFENAAVYSESQAKSVKTWNNALMNALYGLAEKKPELRAVLKEYERVD